MKKFPIQFDIEALLKGKEIVSICIYPDELTVEFSENVFISTFNQIRFLELNFKINNQIPEFIYLLLSEKIADVSNVGLDLELKTSSGYNIKFECFEWAYESYHISSDHIDIAI